MSVTGAHVERALVAERAAIDVDQRLLLGEQFVGAESHLLDLSGPQILYHHVGLLDNELAQRRALFIVVKVDSHRVLTGIEGDKNSADPVIPAGAPGSAIVADFGTFDLDDRGAQGRQNPGPIRDRDATTEFNDT